MRSTSRSNSSAAVENVENKNGGEKTAYCNSPRLRKMISRETVECKSELFVASRSSSALS